MPLRANAAHFFLKLVLFVSQVAPKEPIWAVAKKVAGAFLAKPANSIHLLRCHQMHPRSARLEQRQLQIGRVASPRDLVRTATFPSGVHPSNLESARSTKAARVTTFNTGSVLTLGVMRANICVPVRLAMANATMGRPVTGVAFATRIFTVPPAVAHAIATPARATTAYWAMERVLVHCCTCWEIQGVRFQGWAC